IPIGHSLHQAWVQNTPTDKTRAVAMPTPSQAPQPRASIPKPAKAEIKPVEQAQVAKPSIADAAREKQQALWERGVLYWVGKRYSILALQPEYGEGVYTSYTNGKEG